MLAFKSVSLDDRDLVNKYMYRYGENSCQHSFAAMFCNKAKYEDSICEKNGYLFVLRVNMCTEKERCYLFPMGEINDKDGIKNAIKEIIDDAHIHDKKVRFETITKNAVKVLDDFYYEKFDIEANRDYFEYIYRCEKLATLEGAPFLSKRKDINRFFRKYDGRYKIKELDINDIPNIKAFYNYWLEDKDEEVALALNNEKKAFMTALDNYYELMLRGIVIYIDNVLVAFAYGSQVSETGFDGMVQKADINVDGIYKVLNREMVKLCCKDLEYMNFEEDVGSEGLRKSKLMYQPDILLEKYIAKER